MGCLRMRYPEPQLICKQVGKGLAAVSHRDLGVVCYRGKTYANLSTETPLIPCFCSLDYIPVLKGIAFKGKT